MTSDTSTASDANTISLENDLLRIELSPIDGSIQRVTHQTRSMDLIDRPTGGAPWRVELAGPKDESTWIEEFSSFTWNRSGSNSTVELRWRTEAGMAVEARIELPAGEPAARFFVRVHATADDRIDKVEFPILRGIGDLNDSEDHPSRLAHPHGTGFLFHRPYHLFEPEPIRRQGLRYSPYPEGFSGSSMQFMTYFAENQGGFYFAAHDPSGAMKWLNFYKNLAGDLESTFMHQAPEIEFGRSFDVPYPILVGTLDEGNWYEAAERYKVWATTQHWTAQGRLGDRTDVCEWLLDDVGFATFGINAAHDRAGWLDYFHAITDKPVFHILGVNWPNRGGDYRGNHPGGKEDWFPARFSPANLSAIRRNGDYWAPFEFDLLLSSEGPEGEEISASLTKLPDEKYSLDLYRFPFVCPATSFLRAFHLWRDERLVTDYDADALYYDISANNVLMACRDPQHGHPVGGGGWMVDAYATMWAATKQAVDAAKGSYVPQGAEMVNEVFIPRLDFYQARAEASPLSGFEADRFRDWIRQGTVEKIPLFTYVYHEYGPVRLDGWAKLSPEVGDLFYWVAARVAIWGGLFELNYEFSPLETLEGRDDDPSEHYYDFEPRAYPIDLAKVAFVREVATARSGYARPFLVYGQMARPLELSPAEIELDYHLYNVGRDRPHYNESGSLRVPSVIHAAWRATDGRLGFLFCNLDGVQTQTINLTFDPARYGLPNGSTCRAVLTTSERQDELSSFVGVTSLSLDLAPRRIVLLDVTAHGAPSEEGADSLTS